MDDQSSNDRTPPISSAAGPVSSSSSSSGNTTKTRARLPPETVKAFERVFQKTKHPTAPVIQQLATQYSVDPVKVKTWFNNRKAKEKRLQLEAAVPPAAKSVSPALLDHTLTTSGGVEFNIDEPPVEFTYEMFAAMRDRILLLESQVTSAQQNNKRSAPPPMDDSPHNRPNKRPHLSKADVDAYLKTISEQMESESGKLVYNHLNDIKHIKIELVMRVDEFISVFDEKGGTVDQIPKDPAQPDGEKLVQVEFASSETVANLLGPGLSSRVLQGSLTSPDAEATESIQLWIHSLCVLYDKTGGKATLTFTVLAQSQKTEDGNTNNHASN